jgi:hypothetical protein
VADDIDTLGARILAELARLNATGPYFSFSQRRRLRVIDDREELIAVLANWGFGGIDASAGERQIIDAIGQASFANRTKSAFTSYSLFFSIAAGAFIWFASPWLTGEIEPWNASNNVYWVYLLAVGLVAGAADPRRFWICPIGVFLGQIIGICCVSKLGPLAPIGFLFFVPATSLVSLIGAVVGGLSGAIVRKLVAWRRKRRPISSSLENDS